MFKGGYEWRVINNLVGRNRVLILELWFSDGVLEFIMWNVIYGVFFKFLK